MQMDQLKQRIDRVEECTDEAKRAVQMGAAPQDLRQCIDTMHEQARQAQQACSSSQAQMNQENLRELVNKLEQTGDRAMQACRQAGSSVDPQLQQAVQRAHDEASGLKKQIQMG
ncbi:hypothetical protein WG922_20960 [Ramlibacter sp. AN1015]|uniref:hypothetical protein n=1 Tax=Ramlibacter sp. AN1015 TaxID=3133428 RepID=UPI0030BDEE29